MPSWRKWVIGGFKVLIHIIGSENILTKFCTICPFPSRGHAEAKWGQNFKMLSSILVLITKNDYISDTTIATKYEFNTTLFSAVTKISNIWTLISQNQSYGAWVLLPLQSSIAFMVWKIPLYYSKVNYKIKCRLRANIIDNNKIWYYIGISHNVVNSVQPYSIFQVSILWWKFPFGYEGVLNS